MNLNRQALGDITNDCHKRAFPEDVNPKVVIYNENAPLSDKGKLENLRKAKGELDERPLHFPSGKRHCQIPIAGDCRRENVLLHDTHFSETSQDISSSQPCVLGFMNNSAGVQRAVEAERSIHSTISFGLEHNSCNMPLDLSSESEEFEEDYDTCSTDVTGDSLHMERRHYRPSILNNDSSEASKEVGVDEREIFNQDLLDNVGLVEACSCSFCLKAAYMWMDLTYQDVQGRLASLKKSRRRVNSLDCRTCHNQTTKSTEDSMKKCKSAKTDSDLIQHWRPLFLRTENILLHEIAKLESTLLELQKLRENGKRDLEMINKVPDKS